MLSLFSSPVLRIEQRSSQLEYEISNEAGHLVGRAIQVAGRKPRKGLLTMLGSGATGARVVVQVGALNSAPLFYVDHQDGAPVAIVAPDGAVIGRFVHDVVGVAQRIAPTDVASGAAHIAGMAFGYAPPPMTHRLVDAQDRPLCQLDWTLKRRGVGEGPRWVPVGCACTDMHGEQIAQMEIREATFKDQYIIRLHYQLPEPVRTLVIASPLALDLTRS